MGESWSFLLQESGNLNASSRFEFIAGIAFFTGQMRAQLFAVGRDHVAEVIDVLVVGRASHNTVTSSCIQKLSSRAGLEHTLISADDVGSEAASALSSWVSVRTSVGDAFVDLFVGSSRTDEGSGWGRVNANSFGNRPVGIVAAVAESVESVVSFGTSCCSY